MRVCSLLSSATEILYALGVKDEIVAVSSDSDYPPEVKDKPHISFSNIADSNLTSREIDDAVNEFAGSSRSVYELDEDFLRKLAPDIIFTQDLCGVCSVSRLVVLKAIEVSEEKPTVVSLQPETFSGVLDSILTVGRTVQRLTEAEALAENLRKRMDAVSSKTRKLEHKPRVFCAEWLDPPMAAGHWIPDMVDLAGGVTGLGKSGLPSEKLAWSRVVDYAPELMILMPCGFDAWRTRREAECLKRLAGWVDLPAVQQHRVYAVDSSAYFSRPGPRLVTGLEILAQLMHPTVFRGLIPAGAVEAVSPELES